MGFESCRTTLYQRFLNRNFLASCHQISWIFRTSISHKCSGRAYPACINKHLPSKWLTHCVGFPKFHNRMTDIKLLYPDLYLFSDFPKKSCFVQQIRLKTNGALNALHFWQFRSLLLKHSYSRALYYKAPKLSSFDLCTWVEQSH